MPKIIENRLIEEFEHKGPFTKKELFEFFRLFEPELKEGTLGWRIYDLKNRNIIKSPKRGIYEISYKPKYKPDFSAELIKIAKEITNSFRDVKYCIWETDWINEFSQHQSNTKIVIVEIEKDFSESLYYQLRDKLKHDFYLDPGKRDMDLYVSESEFPVIIKKLITRSPITHRIERGKKVHIPLLEKILVDLFVERRTFYFYQGSEILHIYENAISRYAINFTKLFSYASRRQKEEELKSFLEINMSHLLRNILDD
jgi:hypothetical protein